jgi:CYTH domain-containing protein
MKEIERKFYVDISYIDFNSLDCKFIAQSYLSKTEDQEVRIRKTRLTNNREKYYLQVKTGVGEVRKEESIEIKHSTYRVLKWQIKERPLIKSRYNIEYKGKIIELDVFIDDILPPVVEIEFDSVEEMNNFNYPKWFGKQCKETNYDFFIKINNWDGN